jgi:uncharacterized membrane protein
MDTDNTSFPGISAAPAALKWARVLLGIATLGAIYLVWVSFQNGFAPGCGPESGCNKVLQSHWAYWFDLPVAIPAILVYLGLIGMTVLLQKRPEPDDQRGSWAAIIVMSVMVASAALWFVGLQIFVIKAFCKFCMATHACGFTAALICLNNVPWAKDPTTPMWSSGSGKHGVPYSAMASLIPVGLAGVAVLAGGQVLFPKELNIVKVMNPGKILKGPIMAVTNKLPSGSNYLAMAAHIAKTSHLPPTPNPQRTTPLQLSLYNNDFLLKLDEVPIIGSPTASNIVVCLFDYTCPHCRLLHPILTETQHQLSNQLGIVYLPMPISTNCNPYLPARARSVSNSCELARLGLAVWRADPKAWQQFDQWFFAPENQAGLAEVSEYASRLVGTNRLQTALADPWIEKQLLTDCRLHNTNWIVAGSHTIPQLIMGNAVSAGPLNSVEHLMVLLHRYLDVDVSHVKF